MSGWEPWKNGGGRTRTLASFPQGAGLDSFLWRISLAEIARSGPFSAFPGVERLFTPVAGGPVRLVIDGREVLARPGIAPLRFDGAAEVHAELAGGPMTVLNLMCRPPFRAEVSRGALPPGASWQGALCLETLDLAETASGPALGIGLYG
ncbi:HutD family protein [Poseidonocella sp. HB161398]|uniref:HutD/Ves family protein n=1 Tax=Poseidonocella sp. HB161398 TaxID=2320855 RepID=UPI0014865234|nr:HutD family protein [Poseidonocella sp. HB161398]